MLFVSDYFNDGLGLLFFASTEPMILIISSIVLGIVLYRGNKKNKQLKSAV